MTVPVPQRLIHVGLAGLGHRVRAYVPFGDDWYGYFTRRLAERPANLAFFLRSFRPGSSSARPVTTATSRGSR